MVRTTLAAVAAATIAALALLGTAPSTAGAEPTPSAAPVAQSVTVTGAPEDVTRDDMHVSEPTPEALPEPTPAPACEPGTIPVEDGSCVPPSFFGWDEHAPAVCEGDTIRVEDGSCVPPSFFDEPTPEYATYTVPPCEHDDGYAPGGSCYWDAATMGNGQGASFVVLNGVVYYP